MTEQKRRIEFGDFQTPDKLASQVCRRLQSLGLAPDVIVEPTCGIGAFIVAAARCFEAARAVLGYEINTTYLRSLELRVASLPNPDRVRLCRADFFELDWAETLQGHAGSLLVLGNLPWVTNSTQGSIGGQNMPEKSNFLGFGGFDAISGKANFDISEWMLLEILRWFGRRRNGDIAMLVKTSVARKVLAYAQRARHPVREAMIFGIDAKRHFNAAVDACLLVIRLDVASVANHDYTVFDDLESVKGHRVGHRRGMTVGDLDLFENAAHLLGQSPQKWRSGIKHDASSLMEFDRVESGYRNGLGEVVELEAEYLYPLMKGSDVGGNKAWREKFVLVTQRFVGEPTGAIRDVAPKTWTYLLKHGPSLDSRGSSIYAKSPRFAIFGVGDYAFRPWRIAICGLYKGLRFRLVGPIEGRVTMFDDTVYYVSFDSEDEATEALLRLQSAPAQSLLSSLIFWDEKRPIKTAILNVLDWSKLDTREPAQTLLI